MKGFLYISLLILALPLSACFNPPRWVYSVPPAGVTSPEPDLHGFWERKVTRRFPLGRADYLWKGREWIEIHESGRYKKFHVYVELVEGQLRKIVYRETGTVLVRGRWIYFQVQEAVISDSKTKKDSTKGEKGLFIPDPAQTKNWKNVSVKTVLYHLDESSDALIPASFERFGKVHGHGIHEGAREPYDNSSLEFQKILNVYLTKKPQPHAYYREEKQDPAVFN